VRKFKLSISILNPDFAKIVEKWFKIFVAVQRCSCQSEIIGSEGAYISEIGKIILKYVYE
jgi:hypothetical protein